MPKSYSSDAIEITFDAKLCIHARNCVLGRSDVFDSDARPWIRPENAPVEEIASTIRSCPSGALTFRRKDGGHGEQVPVLNRLRVTENGPLAATGNLDIDGQAATRATFCRCGASGNMPFCDNSHRKIGFVATGEPMPDAKDCDFDDPKQPLAIKPVEGGPLGVVGPVEVVTGNGKRIARGEKQFLCRCGRSSNKPFCDGSHKDA